MNRKRLIYFLILAVAGVASAVFANVLYTKTFIDFRIPLLIWISTGAIAAIIHYLAQKARFKIQQFIGHCFMYTVSIGSYAMFLFMATNYYLPENAGYKVVKAEIMRRGFTYHRDRNFPYAMVKINDFEKKILFNSNVYIYDYQFVLFAVKDGFWGFDVIKTKTLIKD